VFFPCEEKTDRYGGALPGARTPHPSCMGLHPKRAALRLSVIIAVFSNTRPATESTGTPRKSDAHSQRFAGLAPLSGSGRTAHADFFTAHNQIQQSAATIKLSVSLSSQAAQWHETQGFTEATARGS